MRPNRNLSARPRSLQKSKTRAIYEELLKKYEDARVERTSKMVRGAKENTARFHESALATEEGAVKYMESEWSRDPITDRYDWLYRYDVQTTEI